jgi:hypothetical protein
MSPLDVRRLAAVDMFGSQGGVRRRRVIRAEFLIGAAVCIALGGWVLISGQGWWRAVGAWLVGIGANYVPLAWHAAALSRPGALEEELRDLDLRREGRRTGLTQLWILVPFALVIAAG